MSEKSVFLLILDGLGVGEKNISNPFRFKQLESLENLKENFPFCSLSSSGISQGLPFDQPGNCEMGHLVIGTGIVYWQNLPRIDLAIESGEFFKNQKLLYLFKHAQEHSSRIHLLGILSESVNIASKAHLLAILKFLKEKNFSKVYLHLFTDGFDSPPKSALNLLKELLEEIEKNKYPGKLATLIGRFYALDETKNYTLRTQNAFLLILEGKGTKIDDIFTYLQEKYKEPNFNDSFLEPIVLDPEGKIENNDALLFFNYEPKSINQLAEAFLDPNFNKFPRPKRENIYLLSFTKYLDLDYPVIFEPQKVLTNLSRILAENKLSQIKVFDGSRERLFKYYFNGFIEEEHPKETFKILPPFPTENFDLMIERAEEMIDTLINILKEGSYNFIVCNFPIFDIVGHTGDFQLALKVIEKIDPLLKKLIEISLERKYSLIITSDHGNIEKMIDIRKSEKDTEHNTSPVPFFLVDKDFQKKKTKGEIEFFERKILGSLVDIPATILDLMKIKIPEFFEGKSLLKYF